MAHVRHPGERSETSCLERVGDIMQHRYHCIVLLSVARFDCSPVPFRRPPHTHVGMADCHPSALQTMIAHLSVIENVIHVSQRLYPVSLDLSHRLRVCPFGW